MLPPRDFAKLILFYSQEIVLDLATPGKEAKDRAVMNAKLIRETVENMVSYWNYPLKDLLAEIYREHDQSKMAQQAKDLNKRKKR